MYSTSVWRNWQAALCCLGLMVGSWQSHGQSAKGKSRGKRGDDGRQIAVRQVLNRANALRTELRRRGPDRPPFGDHRHHLYAHVQAGKEKWELIGSPSGVFPVIVHQQDRKVDFNLYIPATPAGEATEVTVIDQGALAPFHGLVGRQNGQADQRVRAPSKGKGQKKRPVQRKRHLVVATGPNGRISFSFHYDKDLHAQRIEIRTAQQRVFFNLHHHPPGYEDH